MLWTSLALAGVNYTTIYEEVLPVVEEIAGREFDPKPPLEITTDAGMREVLASEQAAFTQLFYPQVPLHEVFAQAQAIGTRSGALGGKWALFEQKMYLNKSSAKRMLIHARKDTGKKITGEQLAKCILAHELTHALQAQSGAYEKVARLRDEEALMAVNNIGEGHATQVHREACKRLGAAEVVPVLDGLLGVDDERSPYGAGLAFIEHHGDPWELLAAPPRTTREVLDPPLYGKAVGEALPSEGLIEATEMVATGVVVKRRSSFQALVSRSRGSVDVRRALDDFDDGVEGRASRNRGIVSVEILRFRSDEGAKRYLDAVHAELVEADAQFTDVEHGWEAEVSRLPTKAAPFIVTQRITAQGSWVTAIRWINTSVPKKAVEQAQARLEQAIR